jgi:hypothetical protein
MEVSQEKIDSVLKRFEDESLASIFYGVYSAEGSTHLTRGSAIRSVGLQLGIFTEEMLHEASQRAEKNLKVIEKKKAIK